MYRIMYFFFKYLQLLNSWNIKYSYNTYYKQNKINKSTWHLKPTEVKEFHTVSLVNVNNLLSSTYLAGFIYINLIILTQKIKNIN